MGCKKKGGSVADYYKVMDVLEAHNCGWATTQEQYDTTTAGGRLYINLRLSIAQNEADLCGERIGTVFDSKIKHGTAVSGSAGSPPCPPTAPPSSANCPA